MVKPMSQGQRHLVWDQARCMALAADGKVERVYGDASFALLNSVEDFKLTLQH